MLGEKAVADGRLDPDGWVLVRGERWRATAEAPAQPGDTLTVTAVSGLTLRVRKEA
jgi:membrane-bound ClpP family serine protease